MRVIFGYPALLALSSLARIAHADPLPVELDWDAPAECPTRAEVLSELLRITRVRTGRVVTPIRASAQIEHVGSKYRLRLRTEREDQTGDTDLDANECGVLKRGVTLVLALALGDGVDVVAENAEEEPAPEPPAPPKSPLTATPEKAVREAPRKTAPHSPFHLVPALSALTASGFVGSAAFGVEPSLALTTTHFAAVTEAGFWPMHEAARDQGVSARLEALGGTLGACARERFGAFALSGCARGTLGAIHARSTGAFHDGSSTAAYYALGPALALATPLTASISLRIEAALDVSLAPPRFDERDFGEIYRVSRAIPRLALGLAFDPAH